MKILIIGGSGVIGSKLVKHFERNGCDTKFTYLSNPMPTNQGFRVDITEKNSIIEFIAKINPDYVIHTTALTNVDLCEKNHFLADNLNVNGTKNVIEGCKISKSKIVYISTCFVFDGKKQQYFEEDLTSSSTYYGYTKQIGEDLIIHSGLPYLILRTDQPYCWTEKWQHTNSVLRVIDTLQSGKVLNEIIDWYNTPTYVPEFVQATSKLIEYNLTGLFHLVGSEFINRYNWALKTAEVFKLNKNLLKPINSDALNLPAKRSNINLSNNKLFEKTGIRMSNIEEGLIKMLNERELKSVSN